ncbi:MAG: acyl-CoA synthetase [Actinobacteria bacterium]|nr:acyl-CoA synthetase [Actinomycetota bacterium]
MTLPPENRTCSTSAAVREFNLADLFEVVADTVPSRLALVADERRLTYEQLDERANRLAHHLVDEGVTPGDKVAIYAWNRAEWIEAMLAAYKARAVPINVNYRYVADEARHIFENSDAVAVVHERAFAPVLDSVRADLPRLRHFVVLEDGSDAPSDAVPYEDALAAASPERDFDPRSPDDLYFLYTGGTTGVPKGVMWRAEDIFFAALGGGGFGQPPIEKPDELAERVTAEDARSIQMVNAPIMHGGGQWITFITFYSGGTAVLNCQRHFDPDEIWRLVERERCNGVMVVGDAMGRPLAEALTASGASYDTSSVIVVGSGGAILSPTVKEQLRAELPNAMVMDSFGASETGAGGSVFDTDGPAAGPRFTMGEHTTVLDDDVRPVEPGSGVVGRLARRGHIPLGYYKDEEKTAATFLTAADGTRWVIPGDFATVEADGTITMLGRGSVSITTGGEKVYPEEVEAALKSHPDVFDAVVVGVPDDRFVERVAAIVQPRPGAQPALEDLQAHCRAQLAGYKMPRRLVIVDEIVRTPVGKPDYRWAKKTATDNVLASQTHATRGLSTQER